MRPPSFEAADTWMGSERPAGDQLALEAARARAERALFGHAEPARIGRYQLVAPIAGGGMGLVHAAYDPELDRRVALKVVHPERGDDRGRDRLIKEARALARLDHRNVVAVHDVVTHEGEVVIVMELVTGETLASWEDAARRGWREVVAAYLQVGAGLAAAHRLDIVHRDFKPSNAIIGPDHRVRVLDFGLARRLGDAPEGGRVDGARPVSAPTTASSTVVGTPSYAAPEQLAGAPVTAASDQFSFCVALHHALEGVAPFAGDTLDERIASIRSDPPRLGDGRRVPSWLRAIVRRGLAAEPSQRYPSMPALLAELGRPRGWMRWRWPATAAAHAAASVIATLALRAPGALPDCDGGAREALGAWGPAHRAALVARLEALGTPYVPEVQARVLAELDRRTSEWRSVHRGACMDHRRGSVSDALLDRSMLCLHQRLAELAAAVRVLDGTAVEDLPRAVDVVAGLPSAQICADGARLLREPDAPASPEVRARVAAVREQLGTGAALGRAGRTEAAAAALLAADRAAEATHHAPVMAEVKLALGRTLIAQAAPDRAAPVLRDAMQLALSSDQTRLAVEAAARRIYAEGIQSADLERMTRDLDFAEAMSRSLVRDHFARPLLLNNVGVVYMTVRRADDALRYFQLAHDAMAGDPSADLELAIVDQNLAMVSPDPAVRARLSRETWQRVSAALGENHLDTLQALLGYAWFGADTATAYQLITQACSAYRRMHPSLVTVYVECESARGFLAGELDHRDAALAALAAVLEATAASSDPALVVFRQLAAGELALLRGSPQGLTELAAVVATYGGSENWWERKDALQAELGLGVAAAAAGDRAAARRHLDTAVRGFTEITGFNQGILHRLRLAKARRALASVTLESPERDPGSSHQ